MTRHTQTCAVAAWWELPQGIMRSLSVQGSDARGLRTKVWAQDRQRHNRCQQCLPANDHGAQTHKRLPLLKKRRHMRLSRQQTTPLATIACKPSRFRLWNVMLEVKAHLYVPCATWALRHSSAGSSISAARCHSKAEQKAI